MFDMLCMKLPLCDLGYTSCLEHKAVHFEYKFRLVECCTRDWHASETLICLSVSTRLLNFETITSTQPFVILSPAKLMCDGHLLHLELKSLL